VTLGRPLVDSQRALEFVSDLGVDYGQGYHLGTPASLSELG
jgi:EAL domain-containing protein (putative c-di-GMP-specific phosphodiesterase class I)